MIDARRPKPRPLRQGLSLAVLLATATPATLLAQDQVDDSHGVRTGAAALGDWRADAPGVWRKITPADLPQPFATPSASNTPGVVARPPGAALKTLGGFTVSPFVTGLEAPRLIRTAPNGDIFVAESMSGRIRVLRTIDGAAAPAKTETFVEGLDQPFGIAFYPAGPDPQWVYIANTDSVVRIPYRSGDLKARGPAETIVAKLTPSPGGHWTRDIAFSADGSKMYVSVGSASNLANQMGDKSLAQAQAFDADHGLGAAWGPETGRADVVTFTPQGAPVAPEAFATGLRNCVALTRNPQTQDLWCAVNERDGLGDNLVPDYVTRVRAGGFYGWPWYYIGGVEDPRLKGRRPDLAGKTLIRGRDAHYWAPPAQIRTSGIPASGSYLGWVTAKRSLGQGCRIRGAGRRSAANFTMRSHRKSPRWLRRWSVRHQSMVTCRRNAWSDLMFVGTA